MEFRDGVAGNVPPAASCFRNWSQHPASTSLAFLGTARHGTRLWHRTCWHLITPVHASLIYILEGGAPGEGSCFHRPDARATPRSSSRRAPLGRRRVCGVVSSFSQRGRLRPAPRIGTRDLPGWLLASAGRRRAHTVKHCFVDLRTPEHPKKKNPTTRSVVES